MSRDSWLAFAETAEAIAATRAKSVKVAALAAYLREVGSEELADAARYFAGRIFPGGDASVLGAGWAVMRDVIMDLTGADEARLRSAFSQAPDVGEAVFELWMGKIGAAPSLADVRNAFAAVAAAHSAAHKAKVAREFLVRCGALEAKYFLKLWAADLRIGLREGLVEEAIGRAFERDSGSVSRADMLTGDLGKVALLARDDRLHEAAPALFTPLRFMLATPVPDAEQAVARMGETVWVEDKYDGIRCQLHSDGKTVRLYSRDLKEITAQFPEVIAAAQNRATPVIFDGEVLAFFEDRVMPFASLQRRLGRVNPTPEMQKEFPVVYVAWDVLWHNGETLLEKPLSERRRRLESLVPFEKLVLAHLESARGEREVDRLFEDARARLNEGLMLKNPESPYLPGRRGLNWLKLKRPLDTLDCVVVGAQWGYGKRHGLLSDVTFAIRVDETGDLVTLGKAYSGLSDAEIKEMTELLQQITLSVHGNYHVVNPGIVLEIAFDAIQKSSRHKSGFAMRFPRIARWRRDKSVDDINVLSDVARLAYAREGVRRQKVDTNAG